MAEQDVAVVSGRAILGQFLEAEDDRVVGRVRPAAFGAAISAPAGAAIRQRKHAGGAVFDRDADARCDQCAPPSGVRPTRGLRSARCSARTHRCVM